MAEGVKADGTHMPPLLQMDAAYVAIKVAQLLEGAPAYVARVKAGLKTEERAITTSTWK